MHRFKVAFKKYKVLSILKFLFLFIIIWRLDDIQKNILIDLSISLIDITKVILLLYIVHVLSAYRFSIFLKCQRIDFLDVFKVLSKSTFIAGILPISLTSESTQFILLKKVFHLPTKHAIGSILKDKVSVLVTFSIYSILCFFYINNFPLVFIIVLLVLSLAISLYYNLLLILLLNTLSFTLRTLCYSIILYSISKSIPDLNTVLKLASFNTIEILKITPLNIGIGHVALSKLVIKYGFIVYSNYLVTKVLFRISLVVFAFGPQMLEWILKKRT